MSGRKWLPADTFEIRLERPAGFDFVPGQKIKPVSSGIQRSYSLIDAPQDLGPATCAHHIPRGKTAPMLARASIGQIFHLTPALGFFVFQPSRRPDVFVATGTGIALFASLVGVGFGPLPSIRHPEGLYFQDLLVPVAALSIAGLASPPKPHGYSGRLFQGRVTSFLVQELPPWP